MHRPTLFGLLLSAWTIWTTKALPLAHIHMKFVQPPYVQEHGIITDGTQIVNQQSYLSVGRIRDTSRYANQRSNSVFEQDHANVADREYAHQTPDFSNGLEYPDPLLLRGEAAMMAVGHLYGRGELFFSDIPHERTVLRNQELRLQNNLNGNLLATSRHNLPWPRRNR